MPIHDWTRVEAGTFHDFHHTWITEIKRALNQGVLPPDYYAVAEQIAGGLGPDVLTLQHPAVGNGAEAPEEPKGGVALAVTAPGVRMRATAEPDWYAAKAKAVVIRHNSGHRVVGVIEIVSPGNKNSRHGLQSFVDKAVELISQGVHLMIIDLFPPGPRDPQGIHKEIWDRFIDNEFTLPPGKPLTLVSYRADRYPEAFIEPTAVGEALAEMPLFLTTETYVPVKLEASYLAAWEAVPRYWREVIEGTREG